MKRAKFLGDDFVKVDAGKWRSIDGTRQFRVKPNDYLGEHGIGRPLVLNTPHVYEDTYRGDPADSLSLNYYVYCANNPLIYYDPIGHFWEETWDITKGAV